MPVALPKSRLRSRQTGMSLLELIIACSILLILSSAALPSIRIVVVRQREQQLREELREMRMAIDRYKDLADRNLIRQKAGSEGYPPDLQALVNITRIGGGGADRPVRFLRRIPVDPMTGHADWGLRAVQDDSDSHAWSGDNVFDVYSKSDRTALDGTRYSDW